jgi:hypothetical protein
MTEVTELAQESAPEVQPEAKRETKAFPMNAKVVLYGLNAKEFNDKAGIVKSDVKEDGRQEVLIGKKILGIKPANMKYEVRPIEDLSIQDLKAILKEQDENAYFAGMDIADMRSLVKNLETEHAFEYLAHANAKAALEKAKEAELASKASKMKTRANQMADMSPDQIRQQARMMKTVPPAQLRRMNPQLRNMTDEQIRQAAEQMEMMADNPQMLQQMVNQTQNMSPEELHRATTQQQQPKSISEMTPEQLLHQAQMMRSISKDELRKLNPQFAHLTDGQIEQSIVQIEQMAMNPSMLEMMKNQLKDMTPEEMEQMQKDMQQNGPGKQAPGPIAAGTQPPVDTANMLENMTGKQMRDLMNMMKENPEMVQSMLPPGTSVEAVRSSLSMFEGMSDEQLDATLESMKKFQKAIAPIRNAYNSANAVCGGHLVKLIIVFTLFSITYLVLFIATRGSREAADDLSGSPQPVPVLEDNDSEF